MRITYDDTRKDLPPEQLHQLFVAVGWSDGTETPDMIQKGYRIPWVNSTVVVSAWDNERLVGAVRALSDTMFRSVIYDLLVSPDHQRNGIGKELVRRCVARFPDSEWLVGTHEKTSGFYEKIGFAKTGQNGSVFLSIPCKLFTM